MMLDPIFRTGNAATVAGLAGLLILLGSAPAAAKAPQAATAATGVVQAPALPGAQPIAPSDRVFTADQTSNTVTVINPYTNQVLGTLPLGSERLDNLFNARYYAEGGTHGLGFSPDGSLVDVIDVGTNSAVLVDPATSSIRDTVYVGRAPHEGFVSPDGKQVWVAVRGQNYVSVIDLSTDEEIDRIRTAAGPAMVVFSPDGKRAFVDHDRAAELDVIDVGTRTILKRITLTDTGFSPNLEISPDGSQIWLTHKSTGRVSVVNAHTLSLATVLDTGAVTNHVNFISKLSGIFAYVTVGQANKISVFRINSGNPAAPTFVADIDLSKFGVEPHGIWPSPDNTRVYVGLDKSDAVAVIDTSKVPTDLSAAVIATLRVGQEPQALVYVANAVPSGSAPALSQQGLGKRILTQDLTVSGSPGVARVTVREVDTLDMVQVSARGLLPNTHYSVSFGNSTQVPVVRQFTTDARGGGEVLAFTEFFGAFADVVVAQT